MARRNGISAYRGKNLADSPHAACHRVFSCPSSSSCCARLALLLLGSTHAAALLVTPPPAPPVPAVVLRNASHGRSLGEVSTFSALVSALESGVASIQLAAGTYAATSTLTISRSVSLIGSGNVVLDGQNARRVMTISSGSVELVGLSITKGAAYSVRMPLFSFDSHQKEASSVHILCVPFP